MTLITCNVCPKQKEESTCLGTALTEADAAFVSSSSHLSTHEEGDALCSTPPHTHIHHGVHIHSQDCSVSVTEILDLR